MQIGAETLSQLLSAELAGHLCIGFKVGAEVAAIFVPGAVGVALHNPVSVFAVDAGFHQGQQYPLAEHHSAVNVHVAGHVVWVDP